MNECKLEGELKAWVDGQLPADELAAVEAHLASCPTCHQTAAQLQANQAWVHERLSVLPPTPGQTPSTAGALARLQTRIENQPSWKERLSDMFGWSNHRRRPALIALSLVALIAISFVFEPVRAAAGDLLSVFRVRKFAVIPVSLDEREELDKLTALLEQNFFLSEPVLLEEPESWTVTTPEEASVVAGFDVRVPASVPDGFLPKDIQVASQAVGQFEVDLEMARSLFEMIALDPTLLPDSLGEEPLRVTLPPMVTQLWVRSYRTALTFIQVPSPSVAFPDDVDTAALGAAAFQLLGMDEREAKRLSETIDWTCTLVIPVPTDIVSFREVSVEGTDGLLLSQQYDEQGAHTALLWQKEGIVYSLEGNVSVETMMDIVDSID